MAGQDKKGAKKVRGSKAKDAPIITDPRFANIQNDPRYRLPSKRQTHVKLDKRFAHMLDDKDFSRNAAVDRYGRKLARDDTKQQLKKYYRLDEDDEDEEEEEEKGSGDDASIDDDDEIQKELKRVNERDYDPARDGGFAESSSEEGSSSEEEDEEAEELEDAEELDFPDKQQSNVPLGDVTTRIAIVNLDWDNIRAEDLMTVFSSFVPTGGRVLNVTVYPSEFGKERMEREEIEGPPKEIFASKKKIEAEEDEELDSDEEEEAIKKSMLKADEGEEFDSTQLRRYQLERLRYYYAILTFSSKDIAKHVYDLVDGAEYLSSANFFDLRFVPEETDFDDDKPRDSCTRIPDNYKPNEFVTDALQHSKVKLTWDADDKSRKEAQARAFRGSRQEIEENDLKAYLGSDSSDSEDEEDGGVEIVDNTANEGTSSKVSKREAERQRMRALLGLGAESAPASKSNGPVGEMEVTFTSGLAGGHGKDSRVFENEPEIEESTLEKYKRKERERKKRRKEKMQGIKHGDPTDDTKAADNEPTDEAAEGEDELGFNDPFFEDPDGKATAAARRKEEKRKKRAEREAEEEAAAAQRAELELLMVDDKKTGIKHFDMTEIEKAEKQARRKGKGKGKGKNKEVAVIDDFNVDVSDPRFARVFESHEFAIDPTNPRFKATSGMKALLDEGRKRRRNRDDGETEVVPDTQERKKKQKKTSKDSGSEDLKRLVDKVKRQS